MMTLDESRSVKYSPIKIFNKFLTNATVLLSIPIKHALQTHTHIQKKKKQALLLALVLCLPNSSFRPWVT